MTLLLLTGCATADRSATNTDAALSFVALLAAMYLLQRAVAWLSKASFYLTLAVAALVGAGALLVTAVIAGL